jgi:trk system potassium uptake protein TrkA
VKVLIVGCGRVGARLARDLSDHGHEVTVVDSSRQAFDRLGQDFPGRMVLGNGTDQHVLEEAGAAGMDWFISITNGDNRNIMSAQVAREIFQIPKVMTRIYDPIREQVYREMGLYTYCPTVVGAAIARTFFEQGSEAADRARAAVVVSGSAGSDV